jgi:hypothetical protein
MQILAFGGKGVLWFPYRTEIVNEDGRTTSKYPEVQRVSSDIRAIGKYLLGARSIAVYEKGIGSAGGAPPPATGLVTLSGAGDNVTIGLFSAATTNYAIIATRKLDNLDLLTLAFTAQSVDQLDKSTGEWIPIDPSRFNGYEFKIDPGGAELFRLLT